MPVRSALSLLTTCGIICLATPLSAQIQVDTVRLRVIDAESRVPLPEAEVRWNGRVVGRTGDSGQISFPRGSSGNARVRVSRLGFQTAELTAPVSSGGVWEVKLRAEAVALPTLEVEAAGTVRTVALKEFYRRVQTGTGRYFTRRDIDRERPRNVADLLRRLPGVEVYSNGQGDKPRFAGDSPQGIRSLTTEKGECPISYYLDGTPFQPTRSGMIGLDIRPQELEGIEVYRNSSSAPAKYRQGQALCGIILLWKRERM